MQNTWIVLLPPIIALVLAYISRRVALSLLFGIIVAGFIAGNFHLQDTVIITWQRIWNTTFLKDNILMCIFLLILGVIITLIGHTGGIYAWRNRVGRKLNSAKKTETASLFLSSLLFFDDYFSSLTVGSVMHPLTDRFKVPRVKLAFLVDSMAASLCALSPISSWFGAIMTTLRNSQISDDLTAKTLISTDTFIVYLQSLPFIFYSFMIIGSAFYIIQRSISFGPMFKHENIAKKTGNLFGGKKEVGQKIRGISNKNKQHASLLDFILPILILFISVIASFLHSGGYYLFGGTSSLLKAFQSADISFALFSGGLFTLISITIMFFIRKKVTFTEMPTLYLEGINYILPSIIILILAWALGGLLREDLGTGQYLANLLIGRISFNFFPIMFFAAAAITSFCIGSSWGTIAILIPIATQTISSCSTLVVPISAEVVPVLFPVIGAIIAGGIIGDHTSPLSDTTVMSSASTASHHIDHVQTQIFYAIPIAIATSVSFLISGFLINNGVIISALVSLSIGFATSFGLLELLNYLRIKQTGMTVQTDDKKMKNWAEEMPVHK